MFTTQPEKRYWAEFVCFFYGGDSGKEWGGGTAAAGAGETGVRSEEYIQTKY